MLATPNWTAAVIFYLLFIVGSIIFVINPALKNDSWSYALLYGAMFVFFYLYDLRFDQFGGIEGLAMADRHHRHCLRHGPVGFGFRGFLHDL